MEDGRPHNRVVDETIVIGSGRSPASFTVVRIMEDRAVIKIPYSLEKYIIRWLFEFAYSDKTFWITTPKSLVADSVLLN